MLADIVLSRYAMRQEGEAVDLEEAWRVTDLLVRDIARFVRADGARLLVFSANPDDPESDSRFRQLLEARGISFVDILPAFEGNLVDYRIQDDTHWNARGHDAVASFLAPTITKMLDAPEVSASVLEDVVDFPPALSDSPARASR